MGTARFPWQACGARLGALRRWLAGERAAAPAARASGADEAPGTEWGPTAPLVAGMELGQWIRAEAPDLCEVQVLIARHGAAACEIQLGLKADPSDPVPLRSVSVSAAAVADNAFHGFPFAPIADSAGRAYYVYLRSPDAAPGNAIVVWRRPAWDAALGAVVDGRRQPFAWRYLCRYGDGPPEDPADFAVLAERFLRFAVERCRLRPTGRVLDVGCRRGSWAVPLTGYLRDGGAYEGFDIVAADIEWCRTRIASRHPNFGFRLADVYNRAYNPGGRQRASEFRFPWEAESFDFVFLVSVFTHMLPADVEHYLSEIARVLRPGGTCLISFFLLNAESRRLMEGGKSAVRFLHDRGGWATVDPETPEAQIAYEEGFVRGLYARGGLRIEEPIHHGSWAGRAGALAYQDVVVASRVE